MSEMITYRVTISGLLHDGNGWYVNQPYGSAEIVVPSDIKDAQFERLALRAVGASKQGFRRDGWGGDDCWRSGSVGVCAEPID